jgi:hypothetical protein
MSNIDSPGDQSVHDFSSFSNSSDSSEGDSVGELFPGGPLLGPRGLQTSKPLQKLENEKKTGLTKDHFAAFVTESPFSFKNPIFFSASHKTSYEHTRRKF